MLILVVVLMSVLQACSSTPSVGTVTPSANAAVPGTPSACPTQTVSIDSSVPPTPTSEPPVSPIGEPPPLKSTPTLRPVPAPVDTLVPISILSFEISPAEIWPGEPVTLTWNVIAERVIISKLDEAGRLAEPAFAVPLSGTLVLTTSPTLRNWGSFMLFACSEDLHACNQALASVKVACPDVWFFPNPPADCPGSPHHTTIVAQRFEHGLMLWLKASGEIHIFDEIVILYNDDVFSPRWLMVVNDWSPGMPEEDPSIIPPPGYYEPMRGFGKVWRKVQGIRDRLGWATGEEFVVGNGAFQCGTVKYNRCYVTGPDHAIYVLEPESSGWFIWSGPTPAP